MSMKEILKHAVSAGASHIAKVDADHDRIEWLEKHPSLISDVCHYVTDGVGMSVRDAIDVVRRRGSTSNTESEGADA